MRYLTALSFVCAFCAQAFSQITQVTLEPYLVHNGDIPELEGMTTYRVYAECANPNDEISAVYGDYVTPLSITSSEGFYQNPDGENTGWTINPSDFTSVPAREYDSWITIGASNQTEVVGSSPSHVGMAGPFATFSAGGDLIIESESGGMWYVLPGATHAQAGSDLRVLIAQLTAPSNATITGQVNIQIFLNGSSATEVYENLPLSDPCIEFVGCMDPDACNWDPEAECPDSSCVLEDECGICGGSGIPEGICDCEGNLPENGYDCEGVCLNDEDGDGVCDEFEIAGCMDPEACDYNEAATDAVECDYSCLVSMSLELLGIIDFSTPVGGTSGKAIHLLANADIEDLSTFGIGVANNGGGTDGEEFSFPSLSVAAGESLLLVRNQDALEAYFDSCWTEFTHIVQASTSIDQNGDDAIELYEYGEVIETFGDPAVDGTGQDWEYMDSWAYKWNGNWILGGINCTDGTQTIYESSCLYPLCSSGIGCTDSEACNYMPSSATDDGSCYYAAEGYNCDGLCLEDADGDGVCDPFEIAGCMDSAACNYDPLATDEDNTCLAFDECNVCGGAGIPEGACDCEGNTPSPGYGCDGECLSDENQNGICDFLELEAMQADLDEGVYCGEGTIWSVDLGECIAYNPCPKDLDGDGAIGVEDLLQLLNAFGTDCPDPNEPEPAEWTCGDVVNYHGYDYATVQIGEQCWFAENLRTELYQNGDLIPGDLDDEDWSSTSEGAQSVYGQGVSECYAQAPHLDACNEEYSFEQFGILYNWYAVNDARQVCPSGWHVPVSSEWTSLFDLYGGLEVAGVHLKSTEGWSEAWGGTNSSGFGGLPSGYRMWTSGGYVDAGGNGVWWSSTDTGNRAMNALLWGGESVTWDSGDFNFGFSVRCLKDEQ